MLKEKGSTMMWRCDEKSWMWMMGGNGRRRAQLGFPEGEVKASDAALW